VEDRRSARCIVGACEVASPFPGTAVDGLRAEGRLGRLPRALMLYGTVAARLADWDAAIPAADEGRRLAVEFSGPMWQAGADTVTAPSWACAETRTPPRPPLRPAALRL
jgi:hypothetical protein